MCQLLQHSLLRKMIQFHFRTDDKIFLQVQSLLWQRLDLCCPLMSVKGTRSQLELTPVNGTSTPSRVLVALQCRNHV